MTSLPLRAPRIFISDRPLPWLIPLIAILVVFALYPFFYNIYLSLHEFVPRKRELIFVGIENWERLFEDSRMWGALWITLLYTGICLAIQLVLGMVIALLIDSDDPGFGILRGLLTLTLVIPPAITGMMFLLMEDAQFGVITYFLQSMGFLTGGSILANNTSALVGVMLADIWQWTPFMVLIFVAGLRALPTDPFESAMIDGASSWQIFRRLTLPMMSKVIAIAVLIRGIDLFRTFDYVYVMTSGGPGTSTYTLSLYAWQQTFSFIKWGYGATISLFALFVILIAANIFVSLTKTRW
ncbi:carbohydrate ABC transporter permease [Pelagibius sp. Alg239-R121]|uniref:carbohydrate ABC transporter permease n=1 Tax=Pelagibius sp. Alg239-R121 TaxID=2993448 RepID=UPI0024A64C12|nr:sugar ABC transporter permease [Pelagibius sp. Alg239-R121]